MKPFKQKRKIITSIVVTLLLLGWITYRCSYHYVIFSISITTFDIKHKEGGLHYFPRLFIINPYKVRIISDEITKYAHLMQMDNGELTQINGMVVVDRVKRVMKKISRDGFVFRSIYENEGKSHILIYPKNMDFGIAVVIDINTDKIVGFY